MGDIEPNLADPHQPRHTTHSAFGRQSIAQWPFPCMGEEIEADGPFGYDGHLLRPSRKSWSNAETDSHRNARWGSSNANFEPFPP
ncbi:hypothetical protein TNCT_562581 [Trichonephila clavata]|uniref:Uncharacterized protein n=1 Tax=Trichonephila clavata TaxID=2740835 RepID=A0A8X6G6K7_TRICU|nr:hypothetical protein TNCT_562581 [Trichonephila clavata]